MIELFRHWPLSLFTKTAWYEGEQVPDAVEVNVDVEVCAKIALDAVEVKAGDGVGMPAFVDLHSQCLADGRKT